LTLGDPEVQCRNTAMAWQRWITVAAVLVSLAALAAWQWDEYVHECQLARQVVASSADSVMNALVGGVGILAVMLISVRERVREIGLRRAVGACRRDIRHQFLMESAMLAGLGGSTGVFVGVAATVAPSGFGAWDAVISWQSAGIAFVFSVSLGIVFGLYPAIRAASLETIEALRAE